MRRVTHGPVVLFVRDPRAAPAWWLHDYFPATGRLEASRETPLDQLARRIHSRPEYLIRAPQRGAVPLDAPGPGQMRDGCAAHEQRAEAR
jgi:hypothetical protein